MVIQISFAITHLFHELVWSVADQLRGLMMKGLLSV
jgi:hypothetical protein